MIRTRIMRYLLAGMLWGASIWGGAPAVFGADSFILPRYSRTVSLDFKGADLKDVLKAFSLQIGANFILEQGVPDTLVTVMLDNVPVEEALSRVLAANGLSYDYDEAMNLFSVKPRAPDEAKRVISRVYRLAYATVSSSKLISAAASSSQLSGTDASGSSSAAASSSSTASASGDTGGGIRQALAGLLSSSGKITEDARTNSLVITDEADRFPEIERMIVRLDVPVRQVVIEVEILDVSKGAADIAGAKFNLSAAFNGATRTNYYPWNEDNVAAKADALVEYGGGSMDFSGASLALDFLKSRSDTRSLARPRIITMDNETATIQISTDEAIGVVTSTDTNTGQSTKEAERTKTGVLLTVTPQVNETTGEIILSVEPKVIDATSKSTFGNDSFVNPEERSIKALLRVSGGKTVVIGGLLRRVSTATRTGVPFLSDIPLLGLPFRHRDQNTTERELMVFLTPYVMGSGPVPPELKERMDPAASREQTSLPDPRQRLIDREMDKAGVPRPNHS